MSSLSAKFQRIEAIDLPPQILAAIRGSLKSAHWIAIAPNTSSALVTQKTVNEMPPGYTVVLVFKPQELRTLPLDHEDGHVYLLG